MLMLIRKIGTISQTLSRRIHWMNVDCRVEPVRAASAMSMRCE